MKRISYMFCLMLAALVGCQQEDVIREVVSRGPVFRAATEGFAVQTRTSMGADLTSLWSAGDEVAIFAGSTAADRYRLDVRSAGRSSGTFNLIEEGQGDEAAIPANIAIYPYQENLVCTSADESSYQFAGFAYPTVQQYCVGSFADGSYAMAAVTGGSDDYDLAFKNVGGAIKFQLVGKDVISRITLTGKDGEKLSGDAVLTVSLDGTMPSVQMGQSAESSVTLDCAGGVQLTLSESVAFYIAVPPTSFAEGFTVEVENIQGDICSLEASTANAVGRSQILCMPVAKVEFGSADVAVGDYIDEYGANWGQGVIIDGTRWAPVNCGFKEEGIGDKGYLYGKMYQWGRLYGLGYNTTYDASAPDNAEGGSITIAEANVPANANVFYTMSTGNNQSHWFSDAVIEGVWNPGTTESPVKSGFDPCPEGWRMPTQPEMKRLSSNRSEWTEVDGQKGYWFSGSQAYVDGVPAIFLPASGYIANNGRAQQRNNFGRYWASTVRTSDNKIYQLSFSSSNSNMSLTGSSYAHSVRCVAEESTPGTSSEK